MKLRFKDNTVRIRLTRTEVGRIARGEPVCSSTRFSANAALHYRLQVDDGKPLTAMFSDNEVRVSLPRAEAIVWASGDAVSLSCEQPLPDGQLSILVEKDFACLSPRDGDDDDDTFAHPEAGSAEC